MYYECMNIEDSYNKSLKIICLTEESVETLFSIGKGESVIGVSSFVKRPEAATKLPKISLFTSSKVDKIVEMRPDLILGYSDIQKDIAKELIGLGQDVWISNHRSIGEILRYISILSGMVNAKEEGDKLIEKLLDKINQAREFANSLSQRPKIYFEEWDDPMITAIEWVSEIIELCGGISITHDVAKQKMAMDRVVSSEFIIEQNPDIIFGCWCGKKVKIPAIISREGWDQITAVKNNEVYELEPEIFLQPGPAVISDGIDIMIDFIKKWIEKENK